MRLSLRFILPLALILTLTAWILTPFAEKLTHQWFVHDMDTRAELVFHGLEESLPPLLEARHPAKISALFDRLIMDERLYAIAFCDNKMNLLYHTKTFPSVFSCRSWNDNMRKTVDLPSGPLHVYSHDLTVNSEALGRLIIVHDMSFAARRIHRARESIFYFFIGLGAMISILTVTIAQISLKGWITGLRAVLDGEGILRPIAVKSPELRPLVKDLRHLVQDLRSEHYFRAHHSIGWTPQSLKEILHRDLAGQEVLVVSNREPYLHMKRGDRIEVQIPASGLVTALEPVMRACSGTWIAHGSGSADRETVDKYDRVQVPPANPSYQIRRIWLSEEEEAGYYYGFANEGLWPLCHMAHNRPTFRSNDWACYRDVNQKFADAVVSEAKTEDPVILVQDYHFALLPKMIREKLPRATIITFWHIPWPNSEAFGILPWREEVLEGLLGSNILGFHTRFHCSNFINSVDRFLEARIERETSSISYGGEVTNVNHYPISLEWSFAKQSSAAGANNARDEILKLNDFPADIRLGVGVDRLDYTKGIVERFLAVERFLELNPKWVGRFTFIQIAAPSRSKIPQYKMLEEEVRRSAERINQRFGDGHYQPICLKIEHHEPASVYRYYQAADLCFVTSLHDGMNLVAKEFVAARQDEQGVLILSQFTGAANELTEALIINPYDVDQCATALSVALAMSPSEQRARMKSMRSLVSAFNVYRWAGKMLLDAAKVKRHKRFVDRIPIAGKLLTGRFGA